MPWSGSAPSRPVLFLVWADLRETGRCKYCKARIVWLTRFDTGKMLPVDHDYTIRDRQIHEERQIPIGYVVGADVHSCPEGRQARALAERTRTRPRLF